MCIKPNRAEMRALIINSHANDGHVVALMEDAPHKELWMIDKQIGDGIPCYTHVRQYQLFTDNSGRRVFNDYILAYQAFCNA